MSNFRATLKMEFRGRFGLGSAPTRKSWGIFALNLALDALIYGVFLVAAYFVSSMILKGGVDMRYAFLVVASAVSMLIQFVTSTGQLVKVLYYDVDNELLIRFPIDGTELFLAKASYVFINNLIISLVFTLPFYVCYGAFTGAEPAFYFLSAVMAVAISIIPFFSANLVTIPFMHLNNVLRNKFGLKLAFTIAAVVALFSAYMLLLRGILQYYKTSEADVLFSEEFLLTVKRIAGSFVPASFFANILYREKIASSILFIVLNILAISGSSILLSRKSYYPALLKSLEKGRETFTKKTKNKVRSRFSAIFNTELKIIFRSFGYSFQYLAMAIAAPLMVYFCDDLAVNVGDAAVGGAIVPGLTLMVVLIFDTVIVSFASTTVSRNGDAFYITKIIPVSYKTQMFAKVVLYFIVAAASSLLSCLVAWAAFGGEKYGGHMGIKDVASVFFISCFAIITQTCAAILSDLGAPTFEVNAEGELTRANKNVTSSMVLGVVVAVIYGLLAMIFAYFRFGKMKSGIYGIYLVLNLVGMASAAVSLAVLFCTVDKKYDKIVPGEGK